MATKPMAGLMSVATFRRGFVDQKTTVSDFLCTISNSKTELAVTDFDRSYELQLLSSSIIFRTQAHGCHAVFLLGCIFLFLEWLRAYGVCRQVLFRALRSKSGDVEVFLNLNGKSSRDDGSQIVSAVIDFCADVRAQVSDINLAMTALWPTVTAVHVLSRTDLHPDVCLSALLTLFPGFLRLDDDNPQRDVFVEDRKGSGLIYLIKLEHGYAKDDAISINCWTPTRNSLAQLVFDDKHELWTTKVVTTGTTDFVETLSRLPNVQCVWQANNSQLTVLPDCLVCSLPFFISGGLDWLVEVANNARACLPRECRMNPLKVSCISVQTNTDDAETCTVVIALASPISGLPDQIHPPGSLCTPLPVASENLGLLLGEKTVKRLIVYTADRTDVRRAALTASRMRLPGTLA
jgi:hypothetical protein